MRNSNGIRGHGLSGSWPVIAARDRKKAIVKIVHQGTEITSHDQITHVFLSHYKCLLGTTEQTHFLDVQTMYDNQIDLQHLDAPFTQSKVQQAVINLTPNKASGLDGLPNEFIKQQWHSLQPYVMHIFENFFAQQTDLSPMNEARIVLLPKHNTPLTVSDFRPISVINLIPKLIAKVLANRIKPHMHQLVNDHQTAFVRGRLIVENFLATREVLHHVHRSRLPAVLLKLDFAKAYDTLNWGFFLQVMRVRGFLTKMIHWIFHLLTTATSRIEINGTLSSSFKHKRGLRQGDPLSPYLFILAADVFQRMTQTVSVVAHHHLTPKFTHAIVNFQYADDTIIIASTKGSTLHLLSLVIHCFASASGLKVNLDKSSFVPLSIQPSNLHMIEQIMRCKRQSFPITYLGMPLTIRTPSRTNYMPLLDKLEKRMGGWKARFISRAGKLQLIKSVLSTIPTYIMSSFKLPK